MNERTQSGIYDLAQTPSGEIITWRVFKKENGCDTDANSKN